MAWDCPTCGAPVPSGDWDWSKSVSVLVDGDERVIKLTNESAHLLYSLVQKSWAQDGKPKGDWRDGLLSLLFVQFGIDQRMVGAHIESGSPSGAKESEVQ